jgi:hypothetical protein
MWRARWSDPEWESERPREGRSFCGESPEGGGEDGGGGGEQTRPL